MSRAFIAGRPSEVNILLDAGTALIGFVQAHQAWSVPIAFLFAFIKALAFVSLFLPTTVTVLVLGGLHCWTSRRAPLVCVSPSASAAATRPSSASSSTSR